VLKLFFPVFIAFGQQTDIQSSYKQSAENYGTIESEPTSLVDSKVEYKEKPKYLA